MKAKLVLVILLTTGALRAQTRLDSDQMRNDLFAAMAGNTDALKRILDASQKMLAQNPDHAQALVWRGAATISSFFMEAQKGNAGVTVFQKGAADMDRAVALAPDDIEVRIMRSVLYGPASRQFPPPLAPDPPRVPRNPPDLRPWPAYSTSGGEDLVPDRVV